MPTPNLYVHAEEDPFADVPPALQTSDADILFVTDRVIRTDQAGRAEFGSERSMSLVYGSYVVGMGKDIAWSDLVADCRSESRKHSIPLSRREVRVVGSFTETPPRRIVVDHEVREDPSEAPRAAAAIEQFHQEISRRVALYPARKEAFVFIHGFNNTMDDAAFTIASLWQFMGRIGVPIAYSWPGGVSYAYDRESGEFTIYHLKQFLRALASCPDLEKINLIAHSRGTDVTLSALRELNIEYRAAGKDPREQLKLNNVILAAADIDMKVASQRIGAEGLYVMPERMTIYVSRTDFALRAASWLFKSGDRMGGVSPDDLSRNVRRELSKINRLQVINADISGGGFGHDYFHSNPSVSSDLIRILRDNKGPGEENGRPMIRRDDGFWVIQDGYLLTKD